MTKRIINKKLLKEWLKVNGKGSLEMLAFKSGCSASLIQKLCNEDYDVIPQLCKIDGICKVTQYEISELFPTVETEEETA